MSLDLPSIRAPERQLQPAPEDPACRPGTVWRRFVDTEVLLKRGGRVAEVTPTHYKVRGLSDFARLGDIVEQRGQAGTRRGEIVKISREEIVVAPFERSADAGIGDAVFRRGPLAVAPHASWRGRTIDALTRAIDGGPPLIRGDDASSAALTTPAAMTRARVRRPLKTGVRVIDLFTPLCQGQRVGIFAGSGVGKSTILSMIAQASAFDTVVLALVGERGREVREFLEGPLAQNRARAIAVVSTGDESPMMRRLALPSALAIAEYFRDRGEQVLLIADSVTRYAHAARDVAMAAGEPAVSRGYTPSVFSDLPEPSSAPGRARRAPARSPASSPFWSTATTTTTRSPTPSAARSTVMSCSTAPSPTRAATRPSTCSPRSRVWPSSAGPPSSATW